MLPAHQRFRPGHHRRSAPHIILGLQVHLELSGPDGLAEITDQTVIIQLFSENRLIIIRNLRMVNSPDRVRGGFGHVKSPHRFDTLVDIRIDPHPDPYPGIILSALVDPDAGLLQKGGIVLTVRTVHHENISPLPAQHPVRFQDLLQKTAGDPLQHLVPAASPIPFVDHLKMICVQQHRVHRRMLMVLVILLHIMIKILGRIQIGQRIPLRAVDGFPVLYQLHQKTHPGQRPDHQKQDHQESDQPRSRPAGVVHQHLHRGRREGTDHHPGYIGQPLSAGNRFLALIRIGKGRGRSPGERLFDPVRLSLGALLLFLQPGQIILRTVLQGRADHGSVRFAQPALSLITEQTVIERFADPVLPVIPGHHAKDLLLIEDRRVEPQGSLPGQTGLRQEEDSRFALHPAQKILPVGQVRRHAVAGIVVPAPVDEAQGIKDRILLICTNDRNIRPGRGEALPVQICGRFYKTQILREQVVQGFDPLRRQLTDVFLALPGNGFPVIGHKPPKRQSDAGYKQHRQNDSEDECPGLLHLLPRFRRLPNCLVYRACPLRIKHEAFLPGDFLVCCF